MLPSNPTTLLQYVLSPPFSQTSISHILGSSQSSYILSPAYLSHFSPDPSPPHSIIVHLLYIPRTHQMLSSASGPLKFSFPLIGMPHTLNFKRLVSSQLSHLLSQLKYQILPDALLQRCSNSVTSCTSTQVIVFQAFINVLYCLIYLFLLHLHLNEATLRGFLLYSQHPNLSVSHNRDSNMNIY